VLKADDDTFTIMENLHKYLGTLFIYFLYANSVWLTWWEYSLNALHIAHETAFMAPIVAHTTTDWPLLFQCEF
jgi:hypothetical protein